MSLNYLSEELDSMCNKHIAFVNLHKDKTDIQEWYELFTSNWTNICDYYISSLEIELIDIDELLELIENDNISKSILLNLLFDNAYNILQK